MCQKMLLSCKVPTNDSGVVPALLQFTFALEQSGQFF